MNAKWNEMLGAPGEFLAQVQQLAARFQQRAKTTGCDLPAIRAFVKARNYEISDDPDVLRETVAAFVCVLRDYYAQDIKVAGILKRRIEVVSLGYRGELLDLFYRCVFEGLDLAPEGEALSRPG